MIDMFFLACGYEMAGATKARPCGINGAGPETDKQLVHKPEETALEAVGGHAVCSNGRNTSSPLLHG